MNQMNHLQAAFQALVPMSCILIQELHILIQCGCTLKQAQKK